MTETEKLQKQISTLEAEQTALQNGLLTLEEQIGAGEKSLTALMATDERQPSPETSTAVDASEKALAALQSMARRKGAALAACERDLTEARRQLATSKKAAEFIEIQTLLDEIAVRCGVIQEDPMQPALWGELADQVALAKRLWYAAGGRSNDWIGDVAWAKNKLHGALSIHCDWAIGKRVESPPPIPVMSDLMQLKRANGFAKELLGVA